MVDPGIALGVSSFTGRYFPDSSRSFEIAASMNDLRAFVPAQTDDRGLDSKIGRLLCFDNGDQLISVIFSIVGDGDKHF